MSRVFRTLQFRLTAAFVLWTGLFQLAIALGVPLIREPYLKEQVDRAVAEEAGELPELLAQFGGPPAEVSALDGRLARRLAEQPDEIFVQICDARGNVVASSENIEGVVLPFHPRYAAPAATLNSGAVGFETVSIPSLVAAEREEGVRHRARVGIFRVDPPGGERFYVQVGMSLAAVDRSQASLRSVLLLVLLPGMLGAGVAGWIVAGTAVSRIKRIASAVREVSPTRLEERLELPEGDDEIGRMAAEVNAMLHRMAVAVQSHERFISHVSHELKTPVAALLTEAQVLKYVRPDEKTIESFVLSVEDEMRRLGRMVESFLMLARFGHGKRFLAETILPVNDIALESVEHSSLLAWQHGVTLGLTLHDPGEEGREALVQGDSELLRVVIDNLIRNAIQHSKPGNRVQVTIDCSQTHAVLSVLDEGPGIPEEYLDKVFDRFVQAPSVPDAGRRGTGLGLTIAKGVVDLHGGTIKVENRPTGGCAFTIRIPLAVAGGREGAAAKGEARVVGADAVPSPR